MNHILESATEFAVILLVVWLAARWFTNHYAPADVPDQDGESL